MPTHVTLAPRSGSIAAAHPTAWHCSGSAAPARDRAPGGAGAGGVRARARAPGEGPALSSAGARAHARPAATEGEPNHRSAGPARGPRARLGARLRRRGAEKKRRAAPCAPPFATGSMRRARAIDGMSCKAWGGPSRLRARPPRRGRATPRAHPLAARPPRPPTLHARPTCRRNLRGRLRAALPCARRPPPARAPIPARAPARPPPRRWPPPPLPACWAPTASCSAARRSRSPSPPASPYPTRLSSVRVRGRGGAGGVAGAGGASPNKLLPRLRRQGPARPAPTPTSWPAPLTPGGAASWRRR